MRNIVAIDFGSSKVVTAVGEPCGNGIRVVAYEQEPVTIGIKNGEITNDSRIEQYALLPTIHRAEDIIGEKITEAYVNISGRFIHCIECNYSVVRPRPDNDITEKEITEYTAAQFKRKFDDPALCVFDAIPQSFNVDDNIGYSKEEIIGMSGASLDIKYKIIYGNESIIEHRKKVLSNCGIKVLGTILSPIASARAVLNKQEMENGVALVDIGKGCTHIAIIKDNVVRYVNSIPFAGESITNDIKLVTNLSYNWAERVKVEYGCCIEEAIDENKKLILNGENGVKEDEVDLTLLTNVIEARVSEILEAVDYCIEQSGYGKKIPSGIVLTGGSSYLQYIVDLAKALLNRKIRLAAPALIDANSVETSYDTFASTAVGLICEGFEPFLSSSRIEKHVQKEDVVIDEAANNEPEIIENVQPDVVEKEEVHQKQNSSSTKKLGLFSGMFSKRKRNDEEYDPFKEMEQEQEQETPIEESEETADEIPEVKVIDNRPPKKNKPKPVQNEEKENNWGLFKDLFTDNNEA